MVHCAVTTSIRSALCNCSTASGIYTLSLHDALPISRACSRRTTGSNPSGHEGNAVSPGPQWRATRAHRISFVSRWVTRSEEHTSELQSLTNLVCRLLLDKKELM